MLESGKVSITIKDTAAAARAPWTANTCVVGLCAIRGLLETWYHVAGNLRCVEAVAGQIGVGAAGESDALRITVVVGLSWTVNAVGSRCLEVSHTIQTGRVVCADTTAATPRARTTEVFMNTDRQAVQLSAIAYRQVTQ